MLAGKALVDWLWTATSVDVLCCTCSIAYAIVYVDIIFSTVEEGASSVGIHFTDTREDITLELGDVYPLGKSLACIHNITYVY